MNQKEAVEAAREVRRVLQETGFAECRTVVSRTTGRIRYQTGSDGFRIHAGPGAFRVWEVWVRGRRVSDLDGYIGALRAAGWKVINGVQPLTRSVRCLRISRSPPGVNPRDPNSL